MKQLLLIAIISITINSTSFGQTNRIYLDSNWRETTASNAAYYEEWKEDRSGMNGSFKEFYISGKLKKKCNYKDDFLDGLSTSYYENGQLESKGSYKYGKRDGKWESWYENGQLQSREIYVTLFKEKMKLNDITSYQIGEQEEWYEDGQLRLKGKYDKGEKVGVWQSWHENGKLKSEGKYVDGYKEGIWKFWYDGGQIKEKGSFKEGGEIGLWESWHENGQMASKGNYVVVPKKEGYYYTGLPTDKDGLWESWYDNGQLAEILKYRKGDLVGTAEQWHLNGKKAAEYDFGKGKLLSGWDKDGSALVTNGEGKMKHYDFEGNLISSGNYKNGHKVGNWKFFVEEDYSYIKTFEGDEPTEIEKRSSILKDKIFTIVEESAEPVGGMRNFYMYIKRTLKYPRVAKRLGYDGKVFLSFIIDKEGRVTHAYVVKSVCFSLDREALRIVRNSPNWKPGMQYGRAVRQKMTFPLNFRLN